MISRHKEILHILKTATDPLTSSQLSADLQVSSKTVRNDIQELNLWLQEYHMKIESYRGKGYKLEYSDEAVFEAFLQSVEDAGEQIPDEPDKRVNFLIEKLLLHTGYVKMEDLADELYISRSTLQSDLKKVREILNDYDLVLDHKPNYGIKVNGSETKIRFCISEYVFNQKSTVLEEFPDWIATLPKDELDVIRNSIITQLRKYSIIISDVSLQNLMTHLAIACKRIRDNNQVEFIHENEWSEMKDKKEFAVAAEILQDIEESLQVRFPDSEVAYLAIHLQGTKLMNPDNDSGKVTTVIDKQTRKLAQDMVARIDDKYHFNLSNDRELLMNLALHLKPAINRFKFQMNIRNPMLEEIKTQYPTAFEAALVGSEVLYKNAIEFDEHEIGYLALHIEAAQERLKNRSSSKKSCLIVCATGLGSAQLLLYKLKDKLGDMLNIRGTTELYNLRHRSLEDIEFIISTIPIEDELGIPVVYVSTILGDSDVNRIEAAVRTDTSVTEQYIHEHYTFLNRDLETPEEVIRFLGNQLLEAGLVADGYIDSVLERERYAPTCFGNLVAIPHPLEPKTDATFWTIATLKKPIQWDDKWVQIVFLLNINRNKKDDLKPMFNTLVKLTDNRNLIHQLLQCRSYRQFKNKVINA